MKYTVFILIGLVLPLFVFAENATLFLKPASGVISVGDTLEVGLYLDTGGNNINALQADIFFPSDKFQVVSPTIGKSIVSFWTQPPTFSNGEGTISYQGGIFPPGINTSNALISTIVLRAINIGQATLSLKDSSGVFLADGKGTNILGGKSDAIFSIKLPPPAGPKVVAPRQPNSSVWYQTNDVELVWEMPRGANEVSYVLDNEPLTVPDNISEGPLTSAVYRNLPSGQYYFHIKALSSQTGWGNASHLPLRIDIDPPALFSLEIYPGARTAVQQPTINFSTTDTASGISRYALQVVRTSKPAEGEVPISPTPFFIEVTSPFILPKLDFGTYNVLIRAYDLAGNYRDASAKLVISPTFFRNIGPEGLSLRANLIMPWWLVYLILAGGGAAVLYAAHFAYKRHREVEHKLAVGVLNLIENKVSQRLQLLRKKREEFGNKSNL